MAERIAQLYVELSARTDKLEASLKQSQAGLGKFKGGLNDVVKGLTGMDVATIGTAAAVGAVAAGLKYAVGQAMEAERAMAATEAVIKSTGGAAGVTAAQVEDMAGDLSVMTGIADDVIQSGQNMLLTFKEIKGDNFERATVAMNDMAVAMNSGSLEGLDLKATAIQLGKALNDPIKGLTALAKVGVQFTAGQKEAIRAMVEMGDVAGAQRLILEELESQFGGAAEAAGNTAEGGFKKLKNAVGELAEALGKELLPLLGDFATAATLLITMNERINDAFEDQRQSVFETADSYDEYVEGTLAAAVAARKLTQQEADYIQEIRRGERTKELDLMWLGNHTREIGLASEGTFEFRNEVSEAQRALDRMPQTLMAVTGAYDDMIGRSLALEERLGSQVISAETLKQRFSDLSAAIAGPVGAAQDEYYDQQKDAGAIIAALTKELDKLKASHGQVARSTVDGTEAARNLIIAQYGAQTAAEDLVKAQEKLAEDPGDLGLQAAVARAEGALDTAEGAVGEWAGKIKASTEGYVIDNSTAIDAVEGKLGEANAAYAANAVAHEAATRRIVFGFLEQELAAGGTTEAERQFLIDVAQEWGIYDEKTASSLRNYRANLAAAEGDSRRFLDLMDNADGRVVNIEVRTTYTQYGAEPGPGVPVSVPSGPSGGDPIPGGANGMDFTVPAGYPNDSYPIRVQSGEHVQVTPAGQDWGGGNVFNIDARGSTMTPGQYEAITRKVLADIGASADRYGRMGVRG